MFQGYVEKFLDIRIQICPKNSGLYLQSYDLGMGWKNHRSYFFRRDLDS